MTEMIIKRGEITYKNGDFYEGFILNGLPHGKGTYKEASGDFYHG